MNVHASRAKTGISLIVAYDENRAIGYQGGLPWGHLPGDLRRFKQITKGHPIIMYRKTHESIGRALPNRTNIVVSRTPDYEPFAGADRTGSYEEAYELARAASGGTEIFVIGGSGAYIRALDDADLIYATEVEGSFPADAYFPKKDESEWKAIWSEKHEATEESPAFSLVLYEHLGPQTLNGSAA